MYNECCDGSLDKEWEIPVQKRMSFSVFRQTLGKQMLEYDPAKLKYLGDEKSRSVTQGHKKRKKTGGTRQQRKREEESYYNKGGMTVGNFIKAMEMPRLAHDGNLTVLQEHFVNITKKSNKITCEVCGETTYWRCDICCKAVCVTDGARKWNGATCAMAFHNPSFWGLAMSDVHLHKMTIQEWTPPTRQMIKRNEDRVEALKTEIYKLSSL